MTSSTEQLEKQRQAGNLLLIHYTVSRRKGGRKITVHQDGVFDATLSREYVSLEDHLAANNRVRYQRPELWDAFYGSLLEEISRAKTNTVAIIKIVETEGWRGNLVNVVVLDLEQFRNEKNLKKLFVMNQFIQKMNTQEKGMAI